MPVKIQRDIEWAEAKRRCRLSNHDVRMAKELGLNPHSLIKNIPNPKQQWKAPVHIWVRDLYYKRFRKEHQQETARPDCFPSRPVQSSLIPEPSEEIPEILEDSALAEECPF